MWTASARHQYRRSGGRYATDVTDAEFALIEPLLPPAKRGGRRRTTAAQGVSAAEHGPRIFPAVLAGGHLVDDPGHPAHGRRRAGGPGDLADRRDHRQSERRDDRDRRPARV